MVLTPQQLDAIMPDASQLYSDEPEMESSLHYMQLLLLVTCLEWLWRERNDYFIGANLTIYFSRQQLRNRDFRGPDFFLIKQTQKHPRNSWVVWEEDGKYPNLIIELLSTSTADTDRNLKKNLYQDRFHTPEYFYFSPDTLEFAGFRLVGSEYQDITSNANGWRWSQELDLYLGIDSGKLRYFTTEGVLVPTPEEAALQTQLELQQQTLELEQQSLELQQQTLELEQERQRAERLAERLRSLGMDVD
ncbi:Uma2 family endonuclease [Nostoc sp. MG11]|uniref:Uma2 family endonuclease n=1 Tax=Nostoc sp. MG11 TaxID=2721166 RepID=UPI00186663A3|nr:Uma2 family endonuclease [Nostoc sp. MG11]